MNQDTYFDEVKQYFSQTPCKHCGALIDPRGLTQSKSPAPDFLVVQVKCRACGERIGTALVKLNIGHRSKVYVSKDMKRFQGLPAITYDDVLEAHEFFKDISPQDFINYLEKRK